MWDRHSLQTALLGQPAGGDPRQIFFCADHFHRRQLGTAAPEPERRKAGKWLARIAAPAFHAQRRHVGA